MKKVTVLSSCSPMLTVLYLYLRCTTQIAKLKLRHINPEMKQNSQTVFNSRLHTRAFNLPHMPNPLDTKRTN